MERNSLPTKHLKKIISMTPLRALVLSVYVALLFFAVNILVFYSFRSLAGTPLGIGNLSEASQTAVLAATVFSVMVGVLFLIEQIMSGKTDAKYLSKLNRLPTFKDIGLGVAGLLPALVLAGLLTLLVSKLIPQFNVAQAQDVGFGIINLRYEYVLAFLTLVVIAPLAEEIIFRGYLYTKIRARSGVIVSTILVSLTFSLLHLQPNVIVVTFALSLVLCALREYTGGIWASTILHATKNAIAYYMLFVSPILLQ